MFIGIWFAEDLAWPEVLCLGGFLLQQRSRAAAFSWFAEIFPVSKSDRNTLKTMVWRLFAKFGGVFGLRISGRKKRFSIMKTRPRTAKTSKPALQKPSLCCCRDSLHSWRTLSSASYGVAHYACLLRRVLCLSAI